MGRWVKEGMGFIYRGFVFILNDDLAWILLLFCCFYISVLCPNLKLDLNVVFILCR